MTWLWWTLGVVGTLAFVVFVVRLERAQRRRAHSQVRPVQPGVGIGLGEAPHVGHRIGWTYQG
ncbi:hypothetical protein [Nocardioides bruguierae]|uniref:Uncharacterized protein n=1 Tax=Nocardioides bruguierae TaxID=2945102 RepID=A0A9X2D438_9ACTN|nr:hypothetical protein [Nocardioides bruguierae]MCM0618680.1 hypothetical protein [Nocardioides bruguierae]